MHIHDYDEWTVKRFRVEPRISQTDFEEALSKEGNPPLWKDLAIASALAGLFWLAAAGIFA
jgi:hypothetical protein